MDFLQAFSPSAGIHISDLPTEARTLDDARLSRLMNNSVWRSGEWQASSDLSERGLLDFLFGPSETIGETRHLSVRGATITEAFIRNLVEVGRS